MYLQPISGETLTYEMWFEQPAGLTFKVTISGKNATSEEILELARLNWDAIVNAGCRPVSARP